MLSAVAARKAAAAKAAAEASVAAPSKPPSPPPESRSPSSSPIPTPASKPPSKRKPRSSANAGPSKNKRLKAAHVSARLDRSTRYFDFVTSDASKTRNGITVNAVATGMDMQVSSESDSSSGEELDIEMDVPPPAGFSAVSVTKAKRAWSPSRPTADSSDGEEPPGASDPTMCQTLPGPRKPDSESLSTFRSVLEHNVYSLENDGATNGRAVILVLQPNETVALLGAYSLCVLQGSLSLLGVTLSPSDTKHAIFAPRSSPIPVLSWASPDRQGSCTFLIPPAVRQQANTTAILIEYAHVGIEGLGRICKTSENVFKPPRGSDAVPGLDPPRIYIVNHGTRDIHPFVVPTSWEAALASTEERQDSGISTPPVCLVKGPKKSGKSTLARTLVNRLLSRYRRVAFLECDLGQSEFTPGGLVALNVVEDYVFGPPFTHPSLPYRAHYVGSTSPRASPSYYLHSIQSLLETYRLELQFHVSNDEPLPGDERVYDAIPLVVNTMGWTKGLGADLNARIEGFVEASHTFDIDGAEEKGWPSLPQPPQVPTALQTNVGRCVTVEAIRPEMTSTYYTATDHRHLNIMSYFHAVFPEVPACSSSRPGPVLRQITATSWDTSLPLCARYPYEVDYMQAFDRVCLTGPGYEDVVPSELTRVLNGAVVGLVSDGAANGPTRSTSQETSSLPYTPAEPPPDPTLSTCHGLALIRGIPLAPNPRSPHMHVLTPLPTALLGQTRILVKGEMELPIWGMLDFREDDRGRVAGVEKAHVPYLQWGKSEGVGGEKWRVRRNLMRRGQM